MTDEELLQLTQNHMKLFEEQGLSNICLVKKITGGKLVPSYIHFSYWIKSHYLDFVAIYNPKTELYQINYKGEKIISRTKPECIAKKLDQFDIKYESNKQTLFTRRKDKVSKKSKGGKLK